jgi:hypothetical protein
MSAQPFDLEEVYDSEISPLMGQIIEICKRHGMQMTASFFFSLDDEGEERFCTTALPGSSRTLELAAALIKKGVLEHQTVQVVPPALTAFTITKEATS